jgi:drug/metabolite transporter (DMT)-like permease
MTFSAAGLSVATLIAVPIALIYEGNPDIPSGRSMFALAYLALFPTAIATVLLVRVINSAGPSFLSLVNYQVPIWSVVFGVYFLSESLPAQFVTALVIILAGLLISQSKQRRFGRYPSA